LLEFIDDEARSFDSGEYACAQDLARPLLEVWNRGLFGSFWSSHRITFIAVHMSAVPRCQAPGLPA